MGLALHCSRARCRAAASRLAFGAAARVGLLCALALAAHGCKLFDSTCKPDDRSCLGGGQLRSGQECVRTGDCALGLTCQSNICTYAGTTARGGACVATAECGKGLYCSIDLTCSPIADNAQGEGGSCANTSECQQGLVCDVDVAMLFQQGPYSELSDDCRMQIMNGNIPPECKLPRQCVKRGKVDLGSNCKTNSDCVAGLYCVPDPTSTDNRDLCLGGVKLSVEPLSIPVWNGEKCPADSSDAVAYFEVPRGTSADKDFYRLPFPNDIRHHDGKIDLTGHPRPDPSLAPPAANLFLDVAGDVDGFSTNPIVFFRFSRAIKTEDRSLQTLRIVAISKDSPDYGKDADIAYGSSEPDSHYICPHVISLRRMFGAPLHSNTTYAALVTRDLHASDGSSFARSPDFEAMLQDSAPSSSQLSAAWQAYAPLRAFLADGKYDVTADQLLNAAVFTTQPATDLLPKLRAAVESDGTPALHDMTVCKAGVRSPCEDDTGRGACPAESPDFVTIHGHVALPAFQSGTPPYETPADGGEIALGGDGNPSVQGHPNVCFSLTVPTHAAPSGGYPLLIFAHGTGGSFTEPTGSLGLASWAATQAPTPSAVLSIDMPEHGSRRGNSQKPPEDLFFNWNNPKASRGNAFQGAADLMSLTLLAANGIASGDSPTGSAIHFDPSRVVLYGHSQGATHAALMIGYESRVRSVLLSGIGGHLATSLREKSKPVDIGSVLPFALFDADSKGKLAGAEFNPMLALIQGYFDSADPLNYARQLQTEPLDSAPDGHDVFMTYGLFDSYCPEETQQNYAHAAGLSAVSPDLTNQFDELTPPAQGNAMFGTTMRTIALRTYDPIADAISDPPLDGHFVARATKRGLADVQRFLGAALDGKVPPIGQ